MTLYNIDVEYKKPVSTLFFNMLFDICIQYMVKCNQSLNDLWYLNVNVSGIGYLNMLYLDFFITEDRFILVLVISQLE